MILRTKIPLTVWHCQRHHAGLCACGYCQTPSFAVNRRKVPTGQRRCYKDTLKDNDGAVTSYCASWKNWILHTAMTMQDLDLQLEWDHVLSRQWDSRRHNGRQGHRTLNTDYTLHRFPWTVIKSNSNVATGYWYHVWSPTILKSDIELGSLRLLS